MGAYKYKAFISYSHKDRAWAKWLLKRIESYSFPNHLIGSKTSIGTVPRNLKPIFRDREELSAGHNLGEKIEAALTSSKNLIIICSPNAAKSHWVNQEIIYFKRHNRDANIFSVIVEGVPYSEDSELECFPPALKIGIDEAGEETEEPAEPLAADFRAGGDGKRLGVLKLISGMAGLGVNDLIQRDLQRARRRVMTITASAAAIVLAMGVLTFTAIDARNEAQQRRNDAEGQIEFMLTDLKDKLKGVGRLDALDIVGQRALEYYDQYPISEHDADALGRKARVFHYLGEVQDQLGNLDEAERHFNVAFEITEAQLEKDPENPDRIFEHAQSVYWVGFSHYKQQQFILAEPYFEEYIKQAQDLKSVEPNSLRGSQELTYAYTNVGVILNSQKRFQEAVEYYEKALPSYVEIAIQDPTNIGYQLDLANAYAWLAAASGKNDADSEVYEYRTRQLIILGKTLNDNPKNRVVQYRWMTAAIALGYLTLKMDRPDETKSIYSEAIQMSQTLTATDLSNSDWLASELLLEVLLAKIKCDDDKLKECKSLIVETRSKVTNLPSDVKSVLASFHVFYQIEKLEAEIIRQEEIIKKLGSITNEQ